MNFYYQLAPALIGVTITLVQTQVVVALSAANISKIGQEITVQIESKKPRYGSGVIIKRSGNTYTVLTAAHVVEVPDQYEIITPDEKHYPLNYRTIKQLPGVDLALVEFTSDKSYTIAKIGNSDTSIAGTKAYVAGYPEPTFAINESIYTFIPGTINANAAKALRDGYAMVYSNATKKGMSGGPIMNELGEVVGVNGREDLNPNLDKTGFYLGIPINTFLRLSEKVGINLGVHAPVLVASGPKADNFLVDGMDKYNKGDYRGAVTDETEALRLNHSYAIAYYYRGAARNKLGDKRGAIDDYNQALQINPYLSTAYSNRGLAHAELGDKQKAMDDYNQALRIDPTLAVAYYNRGAAYVELGNKQKALEDYNKALQIDPNLALAYNNRGLIYIELGDKQKAIEDYNKALQIDPKLARAYNNRGFAVAESGDKQKAIEDYNKAIQIDPNLALAYNNRGLALAQSGDRQKALEDYNKALQIDPNLALAYYNRGATLAELGEKQKALEDYNKALQINPNLALAYNNRGLIYVWQGDKQKAIEDYNKALQIDPNLAFVYYNRGLARRDLGDKQAASTDLHKAAELFQQQGKTNDSQKALELAKTLEQ
jgi:tetratricopeptide (TPR) repeat protein